MLAKLGSRHPVHFTIEDKEFLQRVKKNANKGAIIGGAAGVGTSLALRGVKDPRFLIPITAVSSITGGLIGAALTAQKTNR